MKGQHSDGWRRFFFESVFRVSIFLKFLRRDGLDRAPGRFLTAPRGGKVRVSLRVYVTVRFGDRIDLRVQRRRLRLRALVLRGTCTKAFWLSLTRSGQLRYGSDDNGALTARSGDDNGRSVV